MMMHSALVIRSGDNVGIFFLTPYKPTLDFSQYPVDNQGQDSYRDCARKHCLGAKQGNTAENQISEPTAPYQIGQRRC